MEESAYIGAVIAGLAFLIAGFRLSRLSLRTGEAPERLLGAAFLLWGFSYLVWELPIILVDESITRPCLVAGRLLNDFGIVASVLFLRLVFRRQEPWGWWLVAGTTLTLLGGLAGSVAVGDWEGVVPLDNAWWWLEEVGSVTSVVWMCAEGFSQYRKARQRLKLGLCDPLVCNRYLLWGLAGATWTLLDFVVVVQTIEYQRTQVWSATLDSLVGGIEIGVIAMIWLVFFPPAFYRRWINRDVVAGTAEGH
jgi:hypothetical protein